MKRLFAILSIITLLLFVSCDATDYSNGNTSINSETQISKPNQEVLFVFVSSNFSEGYYFSASVIDINGCYHPLPDNFSFADSNWRQVILDAIQTAAGNSVEQQHLETMYRFVNEFNASAVSDITTYDHTVWDYGIYNLYAIYTDKDGNMGYKLLCKYGETTQCVNSDIVRDFVNWMIDNRYFSTVANFKY